VAFRGKTAKKTERSFIESTKANKIKVVAVVEISKLMTKRTFIQNDNEIYRAN